MNVVFFRIFCILALLFCRSIYGQDWYGDRTLEGENRKSRAARETGICSYYGAPGEIPPGHPTASGEGFNRFAMKAAHKALPFGTWIRVKNLNNQRTVDVTINDRGPFTPGRIVDLTFGAFGKVARHHDGLFRCSYEIIR